MTDPMKINYSLDAFSEPTSKEAVTEQPFPSGESFAQRRRNLRNKHCNGLKPPVFASTSTYCAIHETHHSGTCLFCKQGHRPIINNNRWIKGNVNKP